MLAIKLILNLIYSEIGACMKIRKYQSNDFKQICKVMNQGRMQELKNENLESVFVALEDASYLKYFLSCNIYVAVKNNKIVGFVGCGRHRIEFLYVDPAFQRQGVGTELMSFVLNELPRPIKLAVFTNNQAAKKLYKKFGFKVIDTVVEKWSDEFPVNFSEDTMELK